MSSKGLQAAKERWLKEGNKFSSEREIEIQIALGLRPSESKKKEVLTT